MRKPGRVYIILESLTILADLSSAVTLPKYMIIQCHSHLVNPEGTCKGNPEGPKQNKPKRMDVNLTRPSLWSWGLVDAQREDAARG